MALYCFNRCHTPNSYKAALTEANRPRQIDRHLRPLNLFRQILHLLGRNKTAEADPGGNIIELNQY